MFYEPCKYHGDRMMVPYRPCPQCHKVTKLHTLRRMVFAAIILVGAVLVTSAIPTLIS